MSQATPSGGAPGVVFMKNMSYTYAWFYLPALPARLP